MGVGGSDFKPVSMKLLGQPCHLSATTTPSQPESQWYQHWTSSKLCRIGASPLEAVWANLF